MGQHRIQRQILQNFSFQGRQPNSREIWWLNKMGHRPARRSIRRVGFFEVDCSEEVDNRITDLEDRFKDPLRRFTQGRFARSDVGREIYDFIAMHYVRSQACCLQIEHVLHRRHHDLGLSQEQAAKEYNRLTSHQDLGVFQDLVEGVARTLTHYLLCPIIVTGSGSFITSDKIMSSSIVESGQRETFVWFPLSSTMGLCLISDGHTGQILGPVVEVDRQSGQIGFGRLPESEWLRCQAPTSQEGREEFFNTLNGMMVGGSTELYATDRHTMDSALLASESPNEFEYRPTDVEGAPTLGL